MLSEVITKKIVDLNKRMDDLLDDQGWVKVEDKNLVIEMRKANIERDLAQNEIDELKDNRITSYNVCYTKLLRADVAAYRTYMKELNKLVADTENKEKTAKLSKAEAQEKAEELKSKRTEIEKKIVDLNKRMDRITSYNVCYTKLLRNRCSSRESSSGS